MRTRSPLWLPLAVLLSALAAGCGSATTATTDAPAKLSDFRNGFVTLKYPTAWAAAEPRVTGTLHVHPILYLSGQPTGNPCRTAGAVTSCGWPISRLRRGGVLIVWENRGYPGWRLASMPGTAVRVGGRPARRLVTRPGICRAVGADETIEVAIARPLRDNWTAVTACLRAPDLAASEQELEAVLASTRFTAP
jgi:hypothetical protein